MNLIINPGSGGIDASGEGWTNTHEQAKKYAYKWFYRPMLARGFTHIEVTDLDEQIEGRWKFTFTHKVTGKTVELEIHGVDNLKAYEKECVFTPRVYWNDSSTGEPELEQFAADGYEPVMTYREAKQ
jgi:hypothetical protein